MRIEFNATSGSPLAGLGLISIHFRGVLERCLWTGFSCGPERTGFFGTKKILDRIVGTGLSFGPERNGPDLYMPDRDGSESL